MTIFVRAALAASVAGLFVSSALAAPVYTATHLGALTPDDSGSTISRAINSAGQVTGYSSKTEGGADRGSRPFISTADGLKDLGSFGSGAMGFGLGVGNAINNSGQVTGSSDRYVSGINKGARAFIATTSGMVDLGTLGTDAAGYGSSSGNAINAAGQVAGESNIYENGVYKGQRAFISTAGGLVNLGALGTDSDGVGYSAGYAINAVGHVTGSSSKYVNGLFQGERAFFATADGGMIDLGTLGTDSNGVGYSIGVAINNAGTITGQAVSYVGGISKGSRAFVATADGGMLDLGTFGTDVTGQGYSEGYDINDVGQVTGASSRFENGVDKGQRAFVWANGIMLDLGTLGTDADGYGSSYGQDINEAGQVVGVGHKYQGNAFLGHRAFLWSENKLYDLNDLVDATLLNGFILNNAIGINDGGQIVAQGFRSGFGTRSFLLSPFAQPPVDTPEPAALTIFVLGFASLAVKLRRR